jgi:hypothetical protein
VLWKKGIRTGIVLRGDFDEGSNSWMKGGKKGMNGRGLKRSPPLSKDWRGGDGRKVGR